LAGLLILSIPVVSGLGAWLVVGQSITLLQGVGMVVVIVVLALVVRRDARLAIRSSA
jgi:drug/metabolite transporter (DMT)-like permease